MVATGLVRATPALLTPAELQPLMAQGQAILVDIREAEAYAIQHVPGALSAPYGKWHAGSDNPGLVPPLAELTELVQSLGLVPGAHAVIVYAGVDANDFGGAARAYWTLKSLGMRELSILNGGLAAWVQAGFDTSSTPGRASRSNWQPQFDLRWMATQEQVLASIRAGDRLLVDARPAPYFEGRSAPLQAKARGTLPGAINLDTEIFFELGSSELLPTEELAHEAEVLNAPPQRPITTFCNAGHLSATEWFVLSELLGYKDVRIYPGSMVDWTNAAAPLPMANEPGRLAQVRYMVLDWGHRNLGTRTP